MSSTRKVLTLKDKIEIINMVESNECSARDIRTKYQISKAQTYQILSRKTDYQAQYSKEQMSGPKAKFKNSTNVEVNTRVWNWFVESKANHIPVNGPMVQKQARKIAKQLGYDAFRASNGWLQCFKLRHSIRFSNDASKNGPDLGNTVVLPRIAAVSSHPIGVEYETIEIEESDGGVSSAAEDDEEYIEVKNEVCFENETASHLHPSVPFEMDGRSDACRNYQDVLDCIHRLQSFSVMCGDSRLLEMSTEMRNYVERNIYGE